MKIKNNLNKFKKRMKFCNKFNNKTSNQIIYNNLIKIKHKQTNSVSKKSSK